jgi:hypothetical protein
MSFLLGRDPLLCRTKDIGLSGRPWPALNAFIDLILLPSDCGAPDYCVNVTLTSIVLLEK